MFGNSVGVGVKKWRRVGASGGWWVPSGVGLPQSEASGCTFTILSCRCPPPCPPCTSSHVTACREAMGGGLADAPCVDGAGHADEEGPFWEMPADVRVVLVDTEELLDEHMCARGEGRGTAPLHLAPASDLRLRFLHSFSCCLPGRSWRGRRWWG